MATDALWVCSKLTSKNLIGCFAEARIIDEVQNLFGLSFANAFRIRRAKVQTNPKEIRMIQLKKICVAFYAVLFLGQTVTWANKPIYEGYRYDAETRKCVDINGREGLNPKFLGDCGDLRGQKLTYLLGRPDAIPLQFRGADLTGADLRGLNLSATDFTDARMDRVLFDLSNLIHVTFLRTRLSGASFQKVTLTDSVFSLSDMNRADFSQAILNRVIFSAQIDLTRAVFNLATLTDVQFNGLTLSKAQFLETRLNQVKWNGATARDLKVTQAFFYACQFLDVDLEGSEFKDVSFDNVVSPDATEKPVNRFERVNLESASFESSKLNQTRFLQTKLMDSNWHDANAAHVEFQEVDLEDAIYTRHTQLPFSDEEARMRGMRFRSR